MTYDVLIVGGGIMGSSTAFNLVQLEPKLKVTVVEKDFTYAQSSTTLSAANLRTVAFSLKENFLISKRTFEILETFEEDMAVAGQKPSICFRSEGNLFLCNGFSGHGLMQGPAVGQYVAECITGRTPTLDLSVFTPARILTRCPIGETGCF